MTTSSLWVERYIGGIAAGGRVLDVACGGGRHIALARKMDLAVVGVDRDVAAARTACAGDEAVMLVERDLEDGGPFPFPPASFDGVIVTNYLWRPILGDIVAADALAGVLLYETFRHGNARFGRPSRADFLLQPGELLAAVTGRLHVVAYEEVVLGAPSRVVQRICAVAPGHRWIELPPELDEVRAEE